MNYELLVIGNERESINEALAAARRGELVALIQGSSTQTGSFNDETVQQHCSGGILPPSHLATGCRQYKLRQLGGGISTDVLRQAASRLGGAGLVRMSELRDEALRIAGEQWFAERSELERLGVDVYCGDVRFVDERTVVVSGQGDGAAFSEMTLTSQRVLLGCGTRSVRPSHVRFDSRRILDIESLLLLDELPRSMIVVGAGETGLDYAMLLGSLGVDVTVIDEKASVFDVYGGLMNDTRLCEMQSLDIAFRLGDEMIGIEPRSDDSVAVRLASGKVFVAAAALICVGRAGETDALNLEAAGVGVDERGRVWCDADGGTWSSHIKAVGDIVGFRAASAMAG